VICSYSFSNGQFVNLFRGSWVADTKHFAGKTILLLGAHTTLGHRLAIRLASAGALLVLTDLCVEPLDPLVRRFPNSVDSLPIQYYERAVLHRLAEQWAQEPLDLILNLAPLRFPATPGLQSRLLNQISTAFAPTLARSGGSVVTVWQEPKAPQDLMGQAQDGALRAAARVLSQRMAQQGARSTAVRLASRIDAGLATDAVLNLAGPSGVGFGPDAVPFVA